MGVIDFWLPADGFIFGIERVSCMGQYYKEMNYINFWNCAMAPSIEYLGIFEPLLSSSQSLLQSKGEHIQIMQL